MTQSTPSLLQDRAFYKTGSPPWTKANNALKAREKRKAACKRTERIYRPRDRVMYTKFYGLSKDQIKDLLQCTYEEIWEYHRHKTLGRMIELAGGHRKRKLRQE